MFTREEFSALTFDQKKEVMIWRSQFHKKKAKATAEVKRIKKKGYNKHHGYHYATESDVKDEMSEILLECGLSFVPDLLHRTESEPKKTSGGGWQTTTTVKMLFTFTDIETGYFEEITHDGTAMDNGDKGIYKAYSNTIKYTLMDYFLIATGDDVEKDSPEINPQQQQNQNQNQQQPPRNNGGNNSGQASGITVKNIMDAEDRLCDLAGTVKTEVRNQLKEKFGVLPKYKDMVAKDQQMTKKVMDQLNAWITNYENPQA